MTDNYFFIYYKTIGGLIKFEMKEGKLKKDVKAISIDVGEIYSVSVLHYLDNYFRIYACLSNNKKVIIFDIDLKKEELRKNKNEISKPGSGHFIKTIEIFNELVATSDTDYIIDIWIKAQENNNDYFHINNIVLESDISNILSVNSEYFISSHSIKKQIYFYDIKSLSIEKSLDNIDCVSSQDSLLLYDDKYIIINCYKGIAIIYIKTKEFVQYIEDFINSEEYYRKEFILHSNNNIYVMYINRVIEKNSEANESFDNGDKKYEIKLFVLKYIDYSFQIIEEFKIFEGEEDLHLTCINDNEQFLFSKSIYWLK